MKKWIVVIVIVISLIVLDVVVIAGVKSNLVQVDSYQYSEGGAFNKANYKLKVIEDKKHNNVIYLYYNDFNGSNSISVVKNN